MADFKGNGAPGNKTNGAIGDTYVNLDNGKQYKCTFAYKAAGDDDYTKNWEYIGHVPVSNNQNKRQQQVKGKVDETDNV